MPYSWNKPPKTMRTQTIRNARAAAKTARPKGPKGAIDKFKEGGVLRKEDEIKYEKIDPTPSASALRNQEAKESLLRAIAEPGVLRAEDIRKLHTVMSRLQEAGVLRKEDEVKYRQQLRGRGRP